MHEVAAVPNACILAPTPFSRLLASLGWPKITRILFCLDKCNQWLCSRNQFFSPKKKTRSSCSQILFQNSLSGCDSKHSPVWLGSLKVNFVLQTAFNLTSQNQLTFNSSVGAYVTETATRPRVPDMKCSPLPLNLELASLFAKLASQVAKTLFRSFSALFHTMITTCSQVWRCQEKNLCNLSALGMTPVCCAWPLCKFFLWTVPELESVTFRPRVHKHP